MNFQTEEEAAQWRRRSGISREDQVFRDTRSLPHPSRGGTRGYDIFFRRYLIDQFLNGMAVPQHVVRSIYRWLARLFPFQMTGNRPQRGLSGDYLLLLILYKLIWPHSSYYECIAFIANESDNARIFTTVAVSNALNALGYTMKVTSTVAFQAFTQTNMLRRNLFWTREYPIGIRGIRRSRLIDAD